MWDMATYWFKHKLLVDSETFQKTCEFYYGNVTFEEAFNKTGKHVCITVSASRANGNTAQRLLLNHISTPHVTIASAYVFTTMLAAVYAFVKALVVVDRDDVSNRGFPPHTYTLNACVLF
jgi:hypothetical protein